MSDIKDVWKCVADQNPSSPLDVFNFNMLRIVHQTI